MSRSCPGEYQANCRSRTGRACACRGRSRLTTFRRLIAAPILACPSLGKLVSVGAARLRQFCRQGRHPTVCDTILPQPIRAWRRESSGGSPNRHIASRFVANESADLRESNRQPPIPSARRAATRGTRNGALSPGIASVLSTEVETSLTIRREWRGVLPLGCASVLNYRQAGR